MGGVFDYQCTVAGCKNRSPEGGHERMRQRAISAGWRVWGKGEPTFVVGEAHCPDHREAAGSMRSK